MIMKLILLGLVLITMSQMVAGFKCFYCNSVDDPECASDPKMVKGASRLCDASTIEKSKYFHYEIDDNKACDDDKCNANNPVNQDLKTLKLIGSHLKGLSKEQAEGKLNEIMQAMNSVEDSLRDPNKFVCRTVTIKIPYGRIGVDAAETTRVFRECGYGEMEKAMLAGKEVDKEEDGKCKTFPGSQGTRIEVCTCMGKDNVNECNSAIGISGSVNSVIVALTLLLWVIMFNGNLTQ